MTDEHGSESQPVHEDIPAEEHPSHDGGGVWSDDHPPVDDFADAGSTHEEAATASHEVATETDEAVSASAATPSRSMLPLFAGIGGVLLIGAVIYWQFGHSPPPPVMPMQVAAPKSASSVSSASVQSDTKPSATVASASTPSQETDIAALYKPPAELLPTTPKETAPATSATSPTPVTTIPAMPSAATLTSPTTTASPVMPAVAPVQPAPSVVSSDTRLDTINTRIDSLQKSLNDATHQLNQLSNMVAATQAMPPVSNQTNPALEDRLNKIEQNVMQIEHNETKKPSVSISAVTEETHAAVVTRTTTHHVKSAVKHKHTRTAKKTKSKMVPSSPPPPAPSPVIAKMNSPAPWVLRAATPGEAWVAADLTSSALRHVQVGDSLTGLGEIRAIRQTPSGWEIEGTAGNLH